MRNYDVEIDKLLKRIEAFELENNCTERQRNQLPAKKIKKIKNVLS